MSRTRTPASAWVCCVVVAVVMASLVHGLVFGAGSVGIGIEPDVDHRARPRRAGALERRTDLARFAYRLAVDAEHVGELLEVDLAEVIADIAALFAVFLDLT